MTTINLSEIDKRLSTVKSMGREFNTFIHETALMIALHAAPKEASSDASGSGNCTRAVKLVRAMPASMRRTMMILWFQTFTPIRIKLSDQGDKCEYDPKYKKLDPAEKLAWWKLAEAAETAFYDLAEDVKEDADKVYDLKALLEMFQRVIKPVKAKIEAGKVAATDLAATNKLISIVESINIADLLAKPKSNDQEQVIAA